MWLATGIVGYHKQLSINHIYHTQHTHTYTRTHTHTHRERERERFILIKLQFSYLNFVSHNPAPSAPWNPLYRHYFRFFSQKISSSSPSILPGVVQRASAEYPTRRARALRKHLPNLPPASNIATTPLPLWPPEVSELSEPIS